MGFFSPLELIRSLLLRFYSCTKQRRCKTRGITRRSSSSRSRRRAHTKDPSLSCNGDLEKPKYSSAITNPNSIPSEEEAFRSFAALYPAYLQTQLIDELREEEYNTARCSDDDEEEERERFDYSRKKGNGGVEGSGQLVIDSRFSKSSDVCLNYSGFGLFSHIQQELDSTSSSFLLSHWDPDTGARCPSNLADALAHAAAATNPRRTHIESGTVEADIRRRIFRFLNIHADEYRMVFAPRKASCFQLIGDSYPFRADSSASLFTMLDYESESISCLEEMARRKGAARTARAAFSFPSLSLCPGHAESILSEGRGLFVFPGQSRASGTKYSYQWMSLARDNGWHVLLDASALGPKEMDALGISLFRPDFIVASFYKSFGSDPTGFCCLFVKNSSIALLSSHHSSLPSSKHVCTGSIVRLVAPPNSIIANNDTDANSKDDTTVVANSEDEHQMRPAEAVATLSSRFSPAREKECSLDPAHSLREMNLVSCLDHGQEDLLYNHNVALENTASLSTQIDPREIILPGNGLLYDSIESIDPSKLHDDLLYDDGLEGIDHRSGDHHDGHCTSLSRFEPGETSSKESIFSNMESSRHELELMPIHNPRKHVDKKKRFSASHSHEYRNDIHNWGRPLRNGSPRGLQAFSQPMEKRNGSFTPNMSEGSQRNYDDDDELDFSSSLYDEDDSDDDEDQSQESDDVSTVYRKDPEIYCRGLNHADALGLNKSNDRMVFLINWLVSSMLNLQHLAPSKPLVQIYGPKVKYDRGASIAFNVFDESGALVAPNLVQMVAKTHNISVGTRVLTNIDEASWLECQFEPTSGINDSTYNGSSPKLRVVTATLGLFTNFADVYKLWAFVAKFLDPQFCKQCRVSNHPPPYSIK